MESLITSWLDAAMPSGEQISCRTLVDKDLPFYIKNSFLALARKRIKLGPQFSQENGESTGINSREVKEAREKLLSALPMTVQFNRADVELCISNALKIRHNLLLQPRQALTAFFFRKKTESPKRLLLRLIGSFGHDIPYLQELGHLIGNCIEDPISYDRFERMASGVQESLYEEQDRKTMNQEIDLLLDFFNSNGSLERPVLEDYLGMRGFKTDLLQPEEKKFWSRDEILDQLRSAKKVSRGFRIIFSDENYFKIYRQRIERQPPGPYPSIYDYLKGKDSKKFLRKLFKNDKTAFNEFISKVDRVSRWRDAKQIIDWELEKRRVDPYSKEAVRIGDVVFAKFFSKGDYS